MYCLTFAWFWVRYAVTLTKHGTSRPRVQGRRVWPAYQVDFPGVVMVTVLGYRMTISQIRLRDVPLGSTVVDPTGESWHVVASDGSCVSTRYSLHDCAPIRELSPNLLVLPRGPGVYVLL